MHAPWLVIYVIEGRRCLDEGVLDVLCVEEGRRVSRLVGEEEEDHKEGEVDDALLQDRLHLHLVHARLSRLRQRLGVRWCHLAGSHLALLQNF